MAPPFSTSEVVPLYSDSDSDSDWDWDWDWDWDEWGSDADADADSDALDMTSEDFKLYNDFRMQERLQKMPPKCLEFTKRSWASFSEDVANEMSIIRSINMSEDVIDEETKDNKKEMKFPYYHPNNFATNLKRLYVSGLGDGFMVVNDCFGKKLYSILTCDTRFYHILEVQDSKGILLRSLYGKLVSTHKRWIGSSTPCGGKSFVACKSHSIQSGININVYYMEKGMEKSGQDAIAFKVRGSSLDKPITFFKGASSTVVARVHLSEDKSPFLMDVVPDEDQEVLASVAVVVHAMKTPGKMKAVACKAAKEIAKVAAVVGISSFIPPI